MSPAAEEPFGPEILIDDNGPVRTITFNRPHKRNAFDETLLAALHNAIVDAGRREDIRAVILTGDDNAFSTGADLNEYVGHGPLQARAANTRSWMRTFDAIESLDKPVIAAVRGYAIAGGTETILACDLVVAAEDSTFGLAEMRVGVMPGAGAVARLTRWVGRAYTKEILMTGDPLTGTEAHRIGLVNRLVPADQVLAEANRLAEVLALRSPVAMAAVKRSVNVASETPLPYGMHYALQEFALLFASDDQQEGMSAFLEKRRPKFTGH
ncbi:enoyl-CoA hydratase/isomerase family protein [Nocardia gamkensis]|uniref:enoyl-CoA hydratase/isomerase family protein n=1 Tax=Nocardia gamkensis TaxID=352869 RepID=UPI0036E93110